MLNWWLGRPLDGAARVPGSDPDAEVPETPAPVFAARALKSAFFGTPGFPQDDTLYGLEKEENTTAVRGNRHIQNAPISPTKPPGILMTPGTGTARRKTVSFGSEVVDNEGREGAQKIVNRTATPHSGKLSSLDLSIGEEPSQPNRKTTLLRTLEDSRGSGSGYKKRNQFSTAHAILPNQSLVKEKDILHSNVNSKEPRKGRAASDVSSSKRFDADMDNDGDNTVDINEPRSQSGKFWKSEFLKYHNEAQEQMKQLVRYKQLAKSYAKKKDAEALDLAEKLKEEQHKVAMMEKNIGELMMQIADGVKVDGDDPPEMMRDLARQTALAFQYRVQVEEFRKAVEEDGNLAAALPKCEAKNTNDGPTDVHSLRDELEKAQEALAGSEKTAYKLREENNKLSQDLLHSELRLEKHAEGCEKRLKLAEEQRNKKDERLQSLQKDYDEIQQKSRNSRRGAEQLLRKRHDQIVGLKKEIASLKVAQSTAQELQKNLDTKSMEHDYAVEEYAREISRLKAGFADSTTTAFHTNEDGYDSLDLFRTTSRPGDQSSASPSGLPVSTHSVTRPSRTVTTSRSANSEAFGETPARRSSHTALSEITNFPSSEKLAFQKSKKVDYTPLANRFAEMSLQSPKIESPSGDPQLPLLTRSSRESRHVASPRPKVINIPSSPPKAAVARSRAMDLSKSQSDFSASRQHVASNRLTSTAGARRSALPPDRVAAAKARLAQKNAEKKRARALGEHIR